MTRRILRRWRCRLAYAAGVRDARADAYRRALAVLEEARP